MKRPTEQYLAFHIYEETKHIKELSGEQRLVFGSLYNLTSKGQKPLEHGLKMGSFTKIVNQHKTEFGFEDKIHREHIEWVLFTLTQEGYVERLEDVKIVRERGRQRWREENPNYRVTPFGLRKIQTNRPGPSGNSLFDF